MSQTKDKQPPLNTCFFEYKTHQSALLEGLNTLRIKGNLLDVSLQIESTVFKAHRAVLAASSDYFRAMFTDNMLEARQDQITLNGLTATGFNEVLEYVYTSRLCLNLANIQDVLKAASHVQLEDVIKACADYLQSQIDVENCVDIVTISEVYSLKQLTMKVYRFMNEHLLEFSTTKEFCRLSEQQLQSLLLCDFPVDCSESDVLRIVLIWLCHAKFVTKPSRIISCINFKEISKRRLDTILSKVYDNSELCKIVLSEACDQTKNFSLPVLPKLVNGRGMELALLKIGGFGLSGITNEITYCFGDKKWKHLTTIPHLEQCNFGTGVLNNELYIVGGCFNQSLQENIHPFGFKYNPRHDKWSTMSPMKIERCRFSLNFLNGFLYAIGGASEIDEFDTSTCEVYNPHVDHWFMIEPLPYYITQHAGAATNLDLFISGGMDRDSIQSLVYCYDPVRNKWEQCASMLQPRADHVMLSIDNKLYVCGGWTEGADGRSRVLVETIDVYNGYCWKVVTKVPTPRYHAGIVCIEKKIYFIGGFYSDDLFDKSIAAIECYDIERNEWTSEDKYPQDIWEHTCATLFIPKWRDEMQDMQVIDKIE